MTTLVGGAPVRMTADDLLAGFRPRLHPGKSSPHLGTNYRIDIEGDTTETWGNYRLICHRHADGWRLPAFRYCSKPTRGNDAVRTHTAEGTR